MAATVRKRPALSAIDVPHPIHDRRLKIHPLYTRILPWDWRTELDELDETNVNTVTCFPAMVGNYYLPPFGDARNVMHAVFDGDDVAYFGNPSVPCGPDGRRRQFTTPFLSEFPPEVLRHILAVDRHMCAQPYEVMLWRTGNRQLQNALKRLADRRYCVENWTGYHVGLEATINYGLLFRNWLPQVPLTELRIIDPSTLQTNIKFMLKVSIALVATIKHHAATLRVIDVTLQLMTSFGAPAMIPIDILRAEMSAVFPNLHTLGMASAEMTVKRSRYPYTPEYSHQSYTKFAFPHSLRTLKLYHVHDTVNILRIVQLSRAEGVETLELYVSQAREMHRFDSPAIKKPTASTLQRVEIYFPPSFVTSMSLSPIPEPIKGVQFLVFQSSVIDVLQAMLKFLPPACDLFYCATPRLLKML